MRAVDSDKVWLELLLAAHDRARVEQRSFFLQQHEPEDHRKIPGSSRDPAERAAVARRHADEMEVARGIPLQGARAVQFTEHAGVPLFLLDELAQRRGK